MAEKVESFADNASFQRGITRVPFSQTTVRHLMVLQTRHDIHPYTCGNRGDGKHEKIGGQSGILVPTVNGWVCPDCDYTQDWVHNSFLNAIIFDVAFDEPTHAPDSTAPAEITVDAEKVWCELLAIYVKLNGPFEDRDDYEDIITVSKPDLIAAIKSTGGGKNE